MVSLETTISRVAELQQGWAAARAQTVPSTVFADQLARAVGAAPASAGAGPTAFQPAAVAPVAAQSGGAGSQMVAIAQRELGQVEAPPGSNDSPRIAEYRTATPGSGVGPWCAYFASWVARQAGVPLGEQGQGFGRVDDVAAWAQRTGRAQSPAAGYTPKPGDLILWGGRHMGMVESVGPDGTVTTIEGNSSDSVARRTYGPGAGGATLFVQMS